MKLQFLKIPANFTNSHYYQKLMVKSKTALLVSGVLIATFFVSLLATQVFALNFTRIFSTKSVKAHHTQKPIKIASANGLTTIPGAFSSSAYRVAEVPSPPAAQKSETIISIKTNGNANPYKLKRQVQIEKKPVALPPPVVPSPNAKRPSSAQPVDNKLRELTNEVVSNLEKLKQQENSQNQNLFGTQDLRRAITALVTSASAKGKSSDYVKTLINDALAGKNAVPTALASANGKLDTKMLLASVLPKTNAKQFGNADSSYLNALESESSELSQPTKVRKKKRARYHVVKRGDNLSKIAMHVYGDPLSYVKIYRANRNILINIHALDVGQRLLIPR